MLLRNRKRHSRNKGTLSGLNPYAGNMDTQRMKASPGTSVNPSILLNRFMNGLRRDNRQRGINNRTRRVISCMMEELRRNSAVSLLL
jgi:hypothetical protein